MGRFGALFRKADGKEKLSSPSTQNPYAQQPPVEQSSPPPQYGDQSPQYDNLSYHQGPQPHGLPSGPRAGLPSGPRQGGVVPVSSRMSTWESNKSAPPAYNQDNAELPPYPNQPPTSASGTPALPSSSASPSLRSAGGTPDLHSTSANPSLGPGYPREKLGASDGVGRNRFDNDAPRYGQAASLPSQRQGGYGNLDTERGGLFVNYNGPPKQASTPNLARPDESDGTQGPFTDMSEMTAEEREEAEAAQKKSEIKQEQLALRDTGRRIVGMLTQGRDQVRAARQNLGEQEGQLDNVERKMEEAHYHISVSRDKTAQLKHVNRGLFRPGFNRSKQEQLDEERIQRELDHQRKMEELRQAERQRNLGINAMQGSNSSRVLGRKAANKEDMDRFAFEADEEQEEAIREHGEHLDQIQELIGDIHLESQGLHEELQASNARLNQLGETTDRHTERILKTHADMKRAAGMGDYR